jgi:hypothetical protein
LPAPTPPPPPVERSAYGLGTAHLVDQLERQESNLLFAGVGNRPPIRWLTPSGSFRGFVPRVVLLGSMHPGPHWFAIGRDNFRLF